MQEFIFLIRRSEWKCLITSRLNDHLNSALVIASLLKGCKVDFIKRFNTVQSKDFSQIMLVEFTLVPNFSNVTTVTSTWTSWLFTTVKEYI